MAVNYGLYLVAALIVVAINAGAVYFAWRALFHDRSHGRRRCPRCWHDLSRTPGMTCSECGYIAQQEVAFRRTRRHWVTATMSIFVCVLVVGSVYWRLDNKSWAAHMPTSVLIKMLPLKSDGGGIIHRELTRRTKLDRLTDSQWATLLERSAGGDRWSRPPSDRWMRSYGQFIRAGRARIAADPDMDWDEDAVAALLEIPPRIDLSTRETWPVGATPRARLRMQDWWPLGAECRLKITPRVENPEPFHVIRASRGFNWYDFSFPIDGLPADTESVNVDVEVERNMAATPADGVGPPETPRWRPMSTASLSVPITFDEDAESGLAPAADRDLTEAVWSAFSRGAVRWESGPAPVRFFFNPQETYRVDFEDLAIGVHVDVFREDQLARRLDIWWLAGTLPVDRGTGWERGAEDHDILLEISEDVEWTMRVTSNPLLAMRAGDAIRYWQGQFTIPLRVQNRRGAAPQPLWVAEESEEASKRTGQGGT